MKVLLIEDDKMIATAIKRGLEGEGFTVEAVLDGTDGLHRASEGQYGAIIVDLMLPGTNGFKICAGLREAGDWTPLLVLTAKNGEFDHTEALDTGADDFLTKPFSFPILVSRLRALLRRVGQGGQVAPVEVGDLRLDSAARRVWRADTEIVLTARQFDVLEFLVRRAGDVVAKDEILQGVWEYDFEGDPNIVEVDLAQPNDAVPMRTNSEVRQEAMDLQALIDDLLHLAASDDASAIVSQKPVDVDDIVLTEIRNHRLERPQVTIDASGVSVGEVIGDEPQLRRAIRNLLNNASRHAGSTVAVHLEQIGDRATVHVDDDGPGVPQHQRETVFDRFTRLDEARSSYGGGTGLGLAITRDIACRHGGTVTCTGSPLGGARFTITLPSRPE